MVGLANYGRTGSLTIAGYSLNGPAWDIPDLSGLWISGDLRGRDRVIPYVSGVKAFQRRLTVTEVDLNMIVSGDVDLLGVAYADAVVGLMLNLEVLRANVVAPTGTGDGTRSATLTLPNGATRTASVHVLGLDTGPVRAKAHERASMRATLTLSIPAGRFA